MKHKHSLYALLSVALLAGTSCSHDTEPGAIAPDGRTALEVTSGIQTRAYDKTWEANDAIGIYMLNNTTVEEANKQYTTPADAENGTFAAAANQTIYFPVDGSTRDFVAYYPHASIGIDNLYAVNVATQTSQKAIDLMGATKVTSKSKTDPSVDFAFQHKLVKLEITLKGDGTTITDAQLANTVVKITNQQTAGTYNVVTGGDVSVTIGSPVDIALKGTNLQAEGIVLPNADTKDMLLTFTVPAPIDQTFSWEIKKAPLSQKFEAGKKYKYTIAIGKQNISVSSTITDWTMGNGTAGENGSAE